MLATAKVLVEGYYFRGDDAKEHASATISLVRDNGTIMVVDPGTLKDPKVLIDALAKEKLTVDDVNIVGITHSHVDHYKNVGMFPKAKLLDCFGVWSQDAIEIWDESFTPHIQILKTPGHDDTSITLFVKTKEGVVAICGDVFWKKNYPELDVYASDLKKLQNSRRLVLEMAHWIIPGHAGMYEVKNVLQFEGIKNGKKGVSKTAESCKKCHRLFMKKGDKCSCRDWLCYRCCECASDCLKCNCGEKKYLK